jgi:putative YphP/YqiW family bacilliredoxin
MRYPEQLIKPMREDLTRHGIEETRTPEEVDRLLLGPGNGTVLMVVNSVCGCAAGKARPGVVEALCHDVVPDRVATAFAGGDIEAVERVRELSPGVPPSSPALYLFKDGRPIHVVPRREIENRQAFEIAEALKQAFDKHCTRRRVPAGDSSR